MEGSGTAVGAVVAVVLLGAVICAFISFAIAKSKGLAPAGYFLAGLFLGVIGIIIAAVASPNRSATQQSFAPAWYPDPWNADTMRYHDGWQWTGHVQPRQGAQPE